MSLTDTDAIDPNHSELLVVFNPSDNMQILMSPLGKGLALHPVQQESFDKITRTAKAEGATLYIPALTTSVFINP